MSGGATPVARSGSRRIWIAMALILVAIVAAANIHLVYVAVTSHPPCVPHLQSPDGSGTAFRAASSAC